MFEKTLYADWRDIDLNGHVGNNVYLEKSVDMLMMWFAEHGFPVGEFVRRSFGRVIMKDELEYFKEFRLLEPIRVTLVLAGLAQDGSRFLIRNEFHKQDGGRVSTII
ncbi:MAG TPA: thioesterase family protein [Anaerolineales bacterium]|jgi:acyl-CoA thioester hydrolase